jgi:hypothetical protein
MALKELKYGNTVIYVEDEVKEEEMGIALDRDEDDKLGNTQEIKPIKLEKDFLEDTLTMEPIGEDYE